MAMTVAQKKDKIAMLDWYLNIGCTDVYSDTPINQFEQNIMDVNMGSEVRLRSSREIVEGCVSIKEIELAIRAFEGCDLKKLAKNTVFADGNPRAEIMLIGEAPGATEDERGIPFCGQSGKLLDNILASIGISRANCYITNTIFWRPPANRRPTPSEIEMCKPFVEKLIALVKPKLIVLVGNTAVEALLNDKATAMSKLRGTYFQYKNQYLEGPIDTTVIFHPSYLLRQPSQKKLAWVDMQKIKKFLTS